MNTSTRRLVDALLDAQNPKLGPLIERARADEFHDFTGPHVCGITTLVGELRALGAEPLAQRAIDGEFDATREESAAWARSPDGQATIRELGEGPARALGFPWPDDAAPATEPAPPTTSGVQFDREAPAPDPKLVELSARALNIVRRDPTDDGMLVIAEKIVQRISRDFPTEGIWCACLWWVDTVQGAVPGLDTQAAQGMGLAFEHAESGRRSTADADVPPAVQWAGRFLLARLRDDPDQCRALFAAPREGWELGAAVMALLAMCAINIERGEVAIKPGEAL